jgi:FkbH-like protein
LDREQKRAAAQLAKKLIGEGQQALAWAQLVAASEPNDDLPLQARYAQLSAGFSEIKAAAQPIKIALLGSSTLDHFSEVLKFWLLKEGFAAELFVSEFDTIRQTVLDPGSRLYAFKPDVVWLFTSHRDVRLDEANDAGSAAAAVQKACNETTALWDALKQRCNAFILQNNADVPLERALGNYEAQVPWSRTSLLRAYDVALAHAGRSGVAIFDLEGISAAYGKARWHDARFWHHSKHAFALDATGLVAFRGARLVGALKGRAKKVLALDLDNTLWGGVVGDDGVDGIRLGPGADGEAHVALQRYAKSLKERGVVLVVVSKNEHANAIEPFQKRPEMALKLDDFAVFRANWNNKADNLKEVAQVLNLGLDSFVFVDDNPAERALVRQLLPMVAVPELPPDPSDYVRALDEQAYFEAVTFSEEDKERSQLYRDNAVRDEAKAKFENLDDFLKSLEMVAEVGPLDAAHLPRMAQLVNKSNQFHLTGTRYSESQLEALAKDPSRRVRYFTLKDKFGDNGLISVVVLEKRGADAHVDTWVMSCRVLSRGMEEFIAKELVAVAGSMGCSRIEGRYVPSKKNGLVEKLYERLGFKPLPPQDGATRWELSAVQPPSYAPFIRREGA